MVSIVKNKVAVFEKMYLHYDFLALGCEVGVCFKKKIIDALISCWETAFVCLLCV